MACAQPRPYPPTFDVTRPPEGRPGSVENQQRRVFMQVGRGHLRQRTHDADRITEPIVTGYPYSVQRRAGVDDPARVVASQLGQHLAERAVIKHQAALHPGQLVGGVATHTIAGSLLINANAVAGAQMNTRPAVARMHLDLPVGNTDLGGVIQVAHGKGGAQHRNLHRPGVDLKGPRAVASTSK